MAHKARDFDASPLIPGSAQARRYGCTCSAPTPGRDASDNPYPDDEKCPVHRPCPHLDGAVWEVKRISLPGESDRKRGV